MRKNVYLTINTLNLKTPNEFVKISMVLSQLMSTFDEFNLIIWKVR
jgi:hypothetical protein